jgi:serine phosphatase RsbU (regulator of sigma subunit)
LTQAGSAIWNLSELDRRRPQQFLALLLLIAAGSLIGSLGWVSLPQPGPDINLFWTASALIVVGGIWFGGWGILGGAAIGFAAGIVTSIQDGDIPTLTSALLFVPADLVQAFIPAFVFRRWKLDPSLPGRRELIAFVLWGATLNRLVGGMLAVAFMRFAGEILGLRMGLEVFARWFLAGFWPCLLFGIPLLKYLTPLVGDSPLFCKTWWGGSPRAHWRIRGQAGLPVAAQIFFGFGLAALFPLLAAGVADLFFRPVHRTNLRATLLPITLNLCFFLSLIVAARVASSLKRRVEALDRGARAIGAGALETRIPDLGLDELGRLGHTFNRMAADLSSSRDALALNTAERERDLKEKEIAWEIQRGFLPQALPEVPGYDFAACCIPSRVVGGDYYDFIPLPGGRLGLVIGDVSGKGIPAALFTGVAKGLLRVTVQGGAGPAQALALVNGQIVQENSSRMFVTMIYAELDPSTGRMRFASAGHTPLVITGADGRIREAGSTGLPVGLLPDTPFGESALTLEAGETLLLYTDGVTEAFGLEDELFGEERLLSILRDRAGAPPEEVLAAIQRGVERFREGTPPSDDLTMVVVKRSA